MDAKDRLPDIGFRPVEPNEATATLADERQRVGARTSERVPYPVAWIPLPAVLGKVGIAMAPGRGDRTAEAVWARDLHTDLRRLRHVHKAQTLVTLVTDEGSTLISWPGAAAWLPAIRLLKSSAGFNVRTFRPPPADRARLATMVLCTKRKAVPSTTSTAPPAPEATLPKSVLLLMSTSELARLARAPPSLPLVFSKNVLRSIARLAASETATPPPC
ncbi:MAG: hypothetical protein R6W83_11935 [Cryobacterium sp.]